MGWIEHFLDAEIKLYIPADKEILVFYKLKRRQHLALAKFSCLIYKERSLAQSHATFYGTIVGRKSKRSHL